MTDDDFTGLSRRRILGGIGAIGAASVGAGLGTSAYFSDTESFENNVLTAGQLDLLVDYYSWWDQGMAGSGSVGGTADGASVSAELTDVKPGDNGLLAFCPRSVDNPAYLWLCGDLVADDENGMTEPEMAVDDSDDAGELADSIELVVSYCELDDDVPDDEDEDGMDGFEPADVESSTEVWTGTLAEFLAESADGLPLDGNGEQPDSDGGFFAPGEQACYAGTADAESDANPCFCIEWELPTEVGNEVQTDSVEFDLTWHAYQCRHNDGTTRPCEADDGPECTECSFEPGTPGDDESNLLSVGPDPNTGFPDIDARVRVDTPDGNNGDLTASNFAICEDGCAQSLDVEFESGGIVDIVVVFDDTFSMDDEIATLQSEVTSLTNDIESAGIDARYALVSFKDEAELDQDFTDASTFNTAVNSLVASGGGLIEEDNLDALAVGTGNAAGQDGSGASLSAFRSGAQRVVIDITDANAWGEGGHSSDPGTTRFSQADVEGFLDDGNFSYYAVSPPAAETGPVSKETIADNVNDGTWMDIDGADFGSILTDIVNSITDPAYILSYTTTNPATDGTTRTVDIQITDPDAGTLYEQGNYNAPS
ncbi:SipW-dependent-type signal peptide-containing protein [Haloarchaeobius baliensis]|uniref:SipW-dependent-type signal peptide-containing protein n=1 Tax=Haloarchaeobius baliensis TaxID=1670458 RepID=UPI003F884400